MRCGKYRAAALPGLEPRGILQLPHAPKKAIIGDAVLTRFYRRMRKCNGGIFHGIQK